MSNNLEKWHNNENLLQAYRQIFVNSQAFLLGVGAILFDKNEWLLISVGLIAICSIWLIWFDVVVARHRAVDYHKNISISGLNEDDMCSESEYIKNKASREEFNGKLKIKTNWRPTRIKLDLSLPFIYTTVWALLIIFKLQE